MNRISPRVSALCLLLAATALFPACTEIDQNLKKAVWMKYVHVANVRNFQVQVGSGQMQLVGVDSGAFWAIFDICTLDVQGNSLSGFSYDANNFVIDAGSAKYRFSTPGTVNAGGTPRSSSDSLVVTAQHDAFSLSPSPQFFPKQFYPNLKYRIAIFVKENPAGYTGGSMTLQYDGQPQVAAVVQNVSAGSPDFRPFYNHNVSPAIIGSCP